MIAGLISNRNLRQACRVGMVSGIADFYYGAKINFRFLDILVEGKQYPKGKEMFLLNYKSEVKVANSCMMFRKNIHINNGLYFSKHYPSIGIDWSYILRFSLISTIYGVHKSLVLLYRRNCRNSITSNKEKMFKASKEVIRSFYYEYPDVINRNDYRYALTTQDIMELSTKSWGNLAWSFLKAFIRNPRDKRWKGYVRKRFDRFFSKINPKIQY